LVQGKPWKRENLLWDTNDYLSNGGDNNFFKKRNHTYDLNYKLKILIDYFKETVPLITQDNQHCWVIQNILIIQILLD
jgi:hypothetical protein